MASVTLSAPPMEKVGQENPISLPRIPIADLARPLGRQIGQGGSGGIYAVRDSNPPRVYKAIARENLANGDEIRICKLAAKVGIAPAFHGAYLVQQGADQFVLIEMDYAGKSLHRWMEDLAVEPEVAKAALIEESASQKAREKALKELEEMEDDGSPYKVVQRDHVPIVEMEEAVDKLYDSREKFFFELFSAYKTLAENNIAYTDGNCGNLIPNRGRGFQLIDFDQASIEKSPARAATKTMRSSTNAMHFHDFSVLPNLSAESETLIAWFADQLARSFAEDVALSRERARIASSF